VRLIAACALLLALAACGRASAAARFCGLADTVNGFDPVAAHRVDCGDALADVMRIERGVRGAWACSRSVGGSIELDCRRGAAELQVLERTPLRARRSGGVVTLANWRFRVRGRAVEGRSGAGWVVLIARAPYCEPTVPREALVALRLRPITPNGGCFS
jgi:hypothetical protein